ncbi:MAG: hypothetical protein AB7I19_11615 [Planctomycetota bacterium]
MTPQTCSRAYTDGAQQIASSHVSVILPLLRSQTLELQVPREAEQDTRGGALGRHDRSLFFKR